MQPAAEQLHVDQQQQQQQLGRGPPGSTGQPPSGEGGGDLGAERRLLRLLC